MCKKKKVRIKSKCRIWEQERRQRMCKAFTALVKMLPSTPTTATKIFILQQAVKHIKELQINNEKLLENEKQYSDEHKSLKKKLSMLEEQCSQLIQTLKDAGLTIPPSINGLDHSTLSPSSVVHDITNKIHQDDEMQSKKKAEDSNISQCPNDTSDTITTVNNEENENLAKVQVSSSKKSLKIRKKYPKKKLATTKSNCTVTPASGVQCSANVLQRNSTINNVWLTNSNLNNSVVIGNTIFPFMPIASPIVMPTVPQPQTIFVVQRPPLSNSQIIKESSVSDVGRTISADGRDGFSFKGYSNVYGMDVTRTTMVNKVPISAFSSTTAFLNSKSTKKRRITRVTQRARRLKFGTTKNGKNGKTESSSSKTNENNSDKMEPSDCTRKESDTGENDKMITSRIDEEVKMDNLVDDKTETAVVDDHGCKDLMSFTNNISSDGIQNENSALDSSLKEIVKNDKGKSNVDMTSTRVDGNKEESIKEIIVNTSPVLLNDVPRKSECDSKMSSNPDIFDKTCVTETNDKNECGNKVNPCKELLKDDADNVPENKSDESVENSSDINKRQSVCDEDNINRLQKNKNHSGNTMGANEIADDILASFGGTSEQTLPTSPLATSPLATSPTVAFLSAFPLVCPGLRPDTPLNDNLQTPNICSLDNFSFFPSKDSSHTSVGLFPDCHSKPIPMSSSKYKQHWLPNMSNSQNFSKSVLSDVNNTTKYSKNIECLRSSNDKVEQEKLPVSSSACIFPDTNSMYHNTKAMDSNNQYSMANMYGYDHLNLGNNSKEHTKNMEFSNNKSDFNYENNSSQNSNKNKTGSNENTCASVVSSYMENIPASIGCNNGKSYNYNVMSVTSSADINNCKRDQSNDNCMKLVLPVLPEYTASTKSLEMSFAFPTQSKSVFPNSSNIYTSCNTYNPFSSDFSSSISCGNSLNPIRTKPTTSFIPDFNSSNIYSQNCNVWSEENNQMDVDVNKIDYNRRLNLSMPTNQNQAMVDFQSDIRFPPLPSSSKCYNSKQENKNIKNTAKCSTKEVKYQNDGKSKSECISQKGPVNWMTSDAGQTGNDMFYSNYKDVKNEQNSLITNVGQTCSESALNCKKGDMFDQPFFSLAPGGYVSQVTTEENQFTWSPSKLTNFADTTSLAPCSLPTLVGDLALGTVTESKILYPSLPSEQDSSVKDRKCVPQKTKDVFVNKSNCSQGVEINASNSSNNFLSVSQLMERGKIDNAIIDNNSTKTCMQESQKRVSESQNRQFNPQLTSGNKPYDLISHSVPSATLFNSNQSTENYSIQQHVDASLGSSKDFNGKLDSNSKNANKNNYSTEALLQNNNTNYQNVRKQKSTHLQKNYGDNSNFSLTGNQYISSNHPLQFDNFSQNQQYVSNTFPYSGSGVTMNSTFYSSANFISTANNTAPTNYMNSGFSVEFNEFSNNLPENIFYPPKTDNCKPKIDTEVHQDTSKYLYNNKTSSTVKDLNTKTKSDSYNKKDSSSQNKRQKKHRNSYPNNFSIPERCFSSITNQVNSPMGFDDSFFGYGSSSQMHSYPSQPPLLTGIQPTVTGQYNQKINFPVKPSSTINMSSSPNPVGTSLTNFNLSTILSTEINKRSTVAGFSDAHHSLSNIPKALPSALYN